MFAQHLYERVCVYTCVHVLVLLQEVVPRPLTVEKQLLPELLQTAAALHQVGRVVPAHRLGTGHTHTHTQMLLQLPRFHLGSNHHGWAGGTACGNLHSVPTGDSIPPLYLGASRIYESVQIPKFFDQIKSNLSPNNICSSGQIWQPYMVAVTYWLQLHTSHQMHSTKITQ